MAFDRYRYRGTTEYWQDLYEVRICGVVLPSTRDLCVRVKDHNGPHETGNWLAWW